MLKKLLLIGAVIALVPMDRENQQALYDVASATAHDIAGFCTRNPNVCYRSSILLDQFTSKAKFAGGMVFDLVKDNTPLGEDPLGRLIDGEVAVRRVDSGPSPMSGEERLPAYADRQTADEDGYRAPVGDGPQPAWRGAAR